MILLLYNKSYWLLGKQAMLDTKKLIISSDWHLRLDSPPDNFINSKEDEYINSIINNNLSYKALDSLFKSDLDRVAFICGGDILDKSTQYEPITLNIIKYITKNRPVFYILGQHDYKTSLNTYMNFLSIFDNFHSLNEKPYYFNLYGGDNNKKQIEVLGFNWVSDPKILHGKLEDTLSAHQQQSDFSVVIFHQLWGEWGSKFDFSSIVEILKKYRNKFMCFSGDLHYKKVYSYGEYNLYTTSCLYPVSTAEMELGRENYGYYYEIVLNDNLEIELRCKYLPKSIYPEVIDVTPVTFYSLKKRFDDLYNKIKNKSYTLSELPFLRICDEKALDNKEICKFLSIYPQNKVSLKPIKKSRSSAPDKYGSVQVDKKSFSVEDSLGIISIFNDLLKNYPKAIELFKSFESIMPLSNTTGIEISKQDVISMINQNFTRFIENYNK